jgi:hypothetical protein
MRELVGPCTKCSKLVFCENGFLNGFVNDQKLLLCASCFNEPKEKSSAETPLNEKTP